EDIDFNPDDFVARVNSDLVGKYINIASRAANFLTRHFDGALGFVGGTDALVAAQQELAEQVRANLENREYGRAIRQIMAYADQINLAFDNANPWLLAKGLNDAPESQQRELQDICSRAIAGFKALSVMLSPILPALAQRVATELFGLERPFVWL